jgi:hypothetical protein
VRTNTVTVKEVILEPCLVPTKPKEIRAEIKKLERLLVINKEKNKIKREIKRLERRLNAGL